MSVKQVKQVVKIIKQDDQLLTDVNESVELEVGADSFKKGSFIKRFKKLLASVVVAVGLGTGTEVVEEPQVEVAEVVEIVETEPVAEVLDAEVVSVEGRIHQLHPYYY